MLAMIDAQAPVRPHHTPAASKNGAKSAGGPVEAQLVGNRVSEVALRLCDKQGHHCQNLSLARLRGAAARELLR